MLLYTLTRCQPSLWTKNTTVVWLQVNRAISNHTRQSVCRFELTSCYRRTFFFLFFFSWTLIIAESLVSCITAAWWLKAKVHEGGKERTIKQNVSHSQLTINVASDPLGTGRALVGWHSHCACHLLNFKPSTPLFCSISCSVRLLFYWKHCSTLLAQVINLLALTTKKRRKGVHCIEESECPLHLYSYKLCVVYLWV